jgi:hypothetical protein
VDDDDGDNDTEVEESGVSDRDFEWIDMLNYKGTEGTFLVVNLGQGVQQRHKWFSEHFKISFQ